LDENPTPASLRDVEKNMIKEKYFKHLGLFRRAGWLVRLGDELVNDPPLPNMPRCKSNPGAGYASEVARLPGVGDYASDAWRLFCKKESYAGHRIVVDDEWRTLEPKDKDLKRYIGRKREEEQRRQLTDTITAGLAAMTISNATSPRPGSSTRPARSSAVTIGSKEHALRIPSRLKDMAEDMSRASVPRASAMRPSRPMAVAS